MRPRRERAAALSPHALTRSLLAAPGAASSLPHSVRPGRPSSEPALRYDENVARLHRYVRRHVTVPQKAVEPYRNLLLTPRQSSINHCAIASGELGQATDS